jgi:hypothetical protein
MTIFFGGVKEIRQKTRASLTIPEEEIFSLRKYLVSNKIWILVFVSLFF